MFTYPWRLIAVFIGSLNVYRRTWRCLVLVVLEWRVSCDLRFLSSGVLSIAYPESTATG